VAGGACVSRVYELNCKGEVALSYAGKALRQGQIPQTVRRWQTYSDTVLRTNCRTILSGARIKAVMKWQYVLMGMAAVLGSLEAVAQAYPSKPIHVITGIAPGGQSDIVARSIAGPLGKRLDQPMW